MGGVPAFGEYAQVWLDSREIAAGTRLNYKGTLNLSWVPHLALGFVLLNERALCALEFAKQYAERRRQG